MCKGFCRENRACKPLLSSTWQRNEHSLVLLKNLPKKGRRIFRHLVSSRNQQTNRKQRRKKRRIQQQSKYDQKKRKRGFQDTWIELFPGLRYKKKWPCPKKVLINQKIYEFCLRQYNEKKMVTPGNEKQR